MTILDGDTAEEVSDKDVTVTIFQREEKQLRIGQFTAVLYWGGNDLKLKRAPLAILHMNTEFFFRVEVELTKI